MGSRGGRGKLSSLDQQALGIVERCLDYSADERDRFLAEHCGASPQLRDKVERMLAMEQTRFKIMPTEAPLARERAPDPVPERVGPFRINGVIGRGGMGIVLRGERDDGVYSQSVAIKLIRAGLKDARARERFALERRILARLTHPAIARILDGGAVGEQPYLVMEYVDGLPVTDYLGKRRAGLRETLDLFGAVCEAVAHAHRNLVVHADIKPSNVLAAEGGAVKLVDFGIARLTSELDRDEVDGPYPVTRGYAAPERLAGEPPTVAGDVYSLGALLHEILSGRAPGEGRDAGFAVPGLPAEAMRGDLAAIVAKATATDPQDRYPEVAALAADIDRYRQKRPVSARQQSFGYRAARFVSRNRLVLAAGFVVFALLTAATIVSLSLYFDARRQRSAAEARFEEVRSLAKFQLFTLYDRLAAVPGTLSARARLAAEAQVYLDRLAAQPGAPAAVKLETAMGYNRLAEIQGVPSSPNLGQIEAAKANLARAERLLIGDRSPAAKREYARNLLMRADMAIWQDNEAAEGKRLLDLAQPMVSATRDGSAEWRRLESRRRAVRLDVLGWSELYAEESAFAGETLAWLDGLPAGERDLPAFIIARAEAHAARAEGDWYSGHEERALVDTRRADQLLGEALREHPNLPELLSARVVSGYNLLTSLEPLGRKEGLLEKALEVVEIGRRLRAMEPNDRLIGVRLRNSEGLAAQLLSEARRHREAIALQSDIVEREERRFAGAPADTRVARDLAFQWKVLGSLHAGAGRAAQGCDYWRRSDALFGTLGRAGRLNDWDKSNVVAGLKTDLGRCG